MSAKFTGEDLRSIKTEKALNIAIFSLLETRNFAKITVRDICEEALVSRATFYLHCMDKYDLLKNCLIYLIQESKTDDTSYEKTEESFNRFVKKNAPIIKNLIYDANDETLTILFDSILSTLYLTDESNENEKRNPKYVVLSNFYAGGILYYFLWQVKNKFPPDVMPMNTCFYELIKAFQKWKLKPGDEF